MNICETSLDRTAELVIQAKLSCLGNLPRCWHVTGVYYYEHLGNYRKTILSLDCAINDKQLRQDEIDTGNIREMEDQVLVK